MVVSTSKVPICECNLDLPQFMQKDVKNQRFFNTPEIHGISKRCKMNCVFMHNVMRRAGTGGNVRDADV
jgi:hypothetical protein